MALAGILVVFDIRLVVVFVVVVAAVVAVCFLSQNEGLVVLYLYVSRSSLMFTAKPPTSQTQQVLLLV